MKRQLTFAVTALALGGLGWAAVSAVPPAVAQTALQQMASAQTMTFAIGNMTCALCPLTVKKAIEGVEGVQSVAVNFDAKTATVIFDPSMTSADAIATASSNAGYPATIKG